jgi:hypothetical protein
MAQKSGVAFAMLDYAGHGSHPTTLDKSTKQSQHIETLAAYDELTKLGYKHIIVIGGSFGGYMTALLTGKRTPKAVVLRAPAAYPNDEFELPNSKTRQYTGNGSDRFGFDKDPEAHMGSIAFEAIAGYTGAVYVLEHEDDEVIPKIIPRTYFSHAKHGNYLLIPNTKHSPKTMPSPEKNIAYIEHLLVSIIKLVQLTP